MPRIMTETIELQRIEIVGTTGGAHLLITGGVHGDEFESMSAIRRLADAVSAEELTGSLTLVPVVNEYRDRFEAQWQDQTVPTYVLRFLK